MSNIRTYLLHPAKFRLDGGAMFGIIPKPLWDAKIKADQKNRIPLDLRLMLFISENHKVLVDTGIGDYHGEKFEGQFDIQGPHSPLKESLALLDLKYDDITDIVISHLHFDHVGGLGGGLDGKEILFPKAKLHVHKKHYEYALNPTARDRGSFHLHVFKDVLDYYIQNNQIYWPNKDDDCLIKDGNFELRYKMSMGHTPYMIHPYAEGFIYMADLVPTEHHISIPWVTGYDIAPGVTVESKQEFYHFIEQQKLTMVFEHDTVTWGGQLSKNEKGRYFLSEGQKCTDEVMLVKERSSY